MFVILLGLLIVIIYLLRRISMLTDPAIVLAKLADLKTSVDTLIALPTNPAPVDLQPIADAVDGLKTEVDNKITAP